MKIVPDDMPNRRNPTRVPTTRNRGKRLAALRTLGLVAAGAALLLWVSRDRLETPTTVAEPQVSLHNDLGATPQKLAPRTVSEQQARVASEVLRGFPLGQKPLAEPIAVLALVGDDEAAAYASQLAQVVKAGGWATTLATTTASYSGVMCLVDNATQFPVHARALTLAFEQAGIACTAANKGAPPSNRIEIVVGHHKATPSTAPPRPASPLVP